MIEISILTSNNEYTHYCTFSLMSPPAFNVFSFARHRLLVFLLVAIQYNSYKCQRENLTWQQVRGETVSEVTCSL